MKDITIIKWATANNGDNYIKKEVRILPKEVERANNDWNALKLAHNLPDCAIDEILKKLDEVSEWKLKS